MKFREHRGTLALDDSMQTCVELDDRAALVEHVTRLHDCFIHDYDFSNLVVKPYFMERDTRCGWEQTYIVVLPGFGPIGFTDGPAERSRLQKSRDGFCAFARGLRSKRTLKALCAGSLAFSEMLLLLQLDANWYWTLIAMAIVPMAIMVGGWSAGIFENQETTRTAYRHRCRRREERVQARIDALRAGSTVIAHRFEPGDMPHQCKHCGWPKGNHL
jgi:hypothetical protein